ncbi:MAG TPA: hypothetical protein VMU47_01220 [Caldimonas sp.]|nr:hypothetical protein [Caldimonas sp.]
MGQASNASTLATVLGSTVFGRAWLVRGVLLLVLGALADRRGLRALVVCAGAVLATLAWAGHANAQSGLDGTLHQLADAVLALASVLATSAPPMRV